MATQNRTVVVETDKNAAAEMAQVAEDVATQELDETVEGGRYEVNGKIVDANGQPLKRGKSSDDDED
jgi:hypothetical protein